MKKQVVFLEIADNSQLASSSLPLLLSLLKIFPPEERPGKGENKFIKKKKKKIFPPRLSIVVRCTCLETLLLRQ